MLLPAGLHASPGTEGTFLCGRWGVRGSLAEPIQVQQLWLAGLAETSPHGGTARATCVWPWAGREGPLSCPGMALPPCLSWWLAEEGLGCALLSGTKLQLSRVFWAGMSLPTVPRGTCLGREGQQGRSRMALLLETREQTVQLGFSPRENL